MTYFSSALPSSAQTYLIPNNPLIKRLEPHLFIVRDVGLTLLFDDLQKKVCFHCWTRTNGDFTDKKILILVGGYTSRYNDCAPILRNTALKTNQSYAAIFFYSYPSGSIPFYLDAREKAKHSAALGLYKLVKLLSQSNIDIAAFSMGVHLTMNALNNKIFKKIQSLHLLGGAEKQDSLNDCSGQNCTQYPQTLKNVWKIYVYATCHDRVLPFHTFATGEDTLGYPRVWSVTLAENVHVIDATKEVAGHSNFLTSNAVLKAIRFLSDRSLYYKTASLRADGTFESTTRQITCPLTPLQTIGRVIHI